MKRSLFHAVVVLSIIVLPFASAHSQQKLAQTGLKFLSVGMDARASSLAGAVTATEGLASSMFYNPAGMSRLATSLDAVVGTTLWIADIDYGVGALAIRPSDGEYGVFGLSFLTVDYGTLYETVPDNSQQAYADLGTFSPTAYAVGLGYAIALNDKFSVGTNIKYVAQSLGNPLTSKDGITKRTDFSTDVLAFDLGVLYRTGYKSLNFGMSIRNFSSEIKYEEENFQLPLTFRIGLSMDVADLVDFDKDQYSLLVTVDAEHPRDFQEQIRVGGELTLFKLFALRAGYTSGTLDEGVTLGVGAVKTYDDQSSGSVGADYAYTPFGLFGSVHRFSFRFSF